MLSFASYCSTANPNNDAGIANLLAAVAPGDTIYVPKGNWKYSTTWTLPNYCKLVGDGPHASFLTMNDPTQAHLMLGSNTGLDPLGQPWEGQKLEAFNFSRNDWPKDAGGNFIDTPSVCVIRKVYRSVWEDLEFTNAGFGVFFGRVSDAGQNDGPTDYRLNRVQVSARRSAFLLQKAYGGFFDNCKHNGVYNASGSLVDIVGDVDGAIITPSCTGEQNDYGLAWVRNWQGSCANLRVVARGATAADKPAVAGVCIEPQSAGQCSAFTLDFSQWGGSNADGVPGAAPAVLFKAFGSRIHGGVLRVHGDSVRGELVKAVNMGSAVLSDMLFESLVSFAGSSAAPGTLPCFDMGNCAFTNGELNLMVSNGHSVPPGNGIANSGAAVNFGVNRVRFW